MGRVQGDKVSQGRCREVEDRFTETEVQEVRKLMSFRKTGLGWGSTKKGRG